MLDRAALIADILHRLDQDVEHVAHRGLGLVHGRLLACDALGGRQIEGIDVRNENDSALVGVARGIDLEGRLLVDTPDGARVRLTSGEVRLAGWREPR
jgi:biotin-(acetyl-CoA carboxylase) ligase